jgi:hypothetical protein
MTAVTRTFIKDATDSRRKKSLVREMGRNPEQALLIAHAIEKDDTLLSGLLGVVADVVQFPACRAILKEVFNRPSVKKRFKDACGVFNTAEQKAYREYVEKALFG